MLEGIGIGVDLVLMARMDALTLEARQRLFTEAELQECLVGNAQRQRERLAGRFAAKEAVLKALGTGLAGGIRWQDVEILALPSGAPRVQLHGKALEHLQVMGGAQVLLSIAHEGEMAMAFAQVISVHP